MYCEVNPLVSVIIPTFNHATYLERALQSLIQQSYSHWEAIIVDNYSTDETEKVVSECLDSRINYLKFYNDGVIGASRNIGIRSANGAWIAFLDSDDWWHPDKLQEFHRRIGKNPDVFYHNLEVIRRTTSLRRRMIKSWQVKPPVQVDLLIRGNALATSSVVVRREILDKVALFSESHSIIACEDYNLWLKIAGVTNGFLYCNRILGYYTDHEESVSRSRDMSLPYKHAIVPFVHTLNSSQRKYVEAKINYQRLIYAYRKSDFKLVIDCAYQSIFNGPVLNRVKSFLIYCVSLIRN